MRDDGSPSRAMSSPRGVPLVTARSSSGLGWPILGAGAGVSGAATAGVGATAARDTLGLALGCGAGAETGAATGSSGTAAGREGATGATPAGALVAFAVVLSTLLKMRVMASLTGLPAAPPMLAPAPAAACSAKLWLKPQTTQADASNENLMMRMIHSEAIRKPAPSRKHLMFKEKTQGCAAPGRPTLPHLYKRCLHFTLKWR